VLGALGLVLPGLFHIRPGLTPLAAAGLVVIMIGATVVTWTQMGADRPAPEGRARTAPPHPQPLRRNACDS